MTTPFGLQGPDLVAALRALPTDDDRAAWEAKTVSLHSPGVVLGGETIVRAVDQPVHVGPSRELLPAAFTDVEKLGLSVYRASHCGEADMIAHARRRVAQRNAVGATTGARRAVGLVRWCAAQVRVVRTVGDPITRAMAVYDSGLAGDRAEAAHADIVAFPRDAAARRARKWLYDQAKGAVQWFDDPLSNTPSPRSNN